MSSSSNRDLDAVDAALVGDELVAEGVPAGQVAEVDPDRVEQLLGARLAVALGAVEGLPVMVEVGRAPAGADEPLAGSRLEHGRALEPGGVLAVDGLAAVLGLEVVEAHDGAPSPVGGLW
jgi:hypothetical protein